MNAGTIRSDTGGDLLINAFDSLVNTGTIATSGGGEISLTGFTLDNTGGTIDATNGNVTLAGNITLTGDSTVLGTLETTGFNTLDSLTTAGSIRVTNASDLAVNGTITNNGTITLDGTNSGTELRVNSDTTLAGTGEVVIGPDGGSSGVNLIGDDGNAIPRTTLTNGVDHTIRALGVGQLGRSTTNIVNDGLGRQRWRRPDDQPQRHLHQQRRPHRDRPTARSALAAACSKTAGASTPPTARLCLPEASRFAAREASPAPWKLLV